MLDAIANIFRIPELRSRVLFTLLILALIQIGQFVTIPFINPNALNEQLSQGGLFSMLNMFSGGAFGQCSIFALGIMPYISASIILQLMTVTSPYLEELSKKGEEGRRKINQYTRYGTVLITSIQSFMLSFSLEAGLLGDIVYSPGWGFRFLCVVTITAGSILLMWMGELITEHGIGNGISLIIFANIVALIPSAFSRASVLLYNEDPSFTPLTAIITMAVFVVVIAGVVYIQFGQRRVPIKRGREVRGSKMYASQSNSYLPLRVNTAGVIPVIFAAAILSLPQFVIQLTTPLQTSENFQWIYNAFFWLSESMRPGMLVYSIFYILLIIFFCYYYTAITFNPKDVAENLQRSGATIPGYSHGHRTEAYLTKILSRITFSGAIFLALVAIMPDVMAAWLDVPYDLAGLLGGTSIIIIVGVALDTVNQLENHLRVRNYDGFLKKGKVRGRSGM